MNDSERFMQELEADQEMESLKARILDLFAQSPDDPLVRESLDDYEQTYGKDLFWKLISFDLAEVEHDIDGMKALEAMMADEPIGDIMKALNAARIAYSEEDYPRAMEELNQASPMSDSEEDLIYLHLRGIVAFALKDYKESARCMEDVMLDMNDEQIAGITGLCYLRLGDEERAKEYLERMLEDNRSEDYGWLYDLLTTFHEFDIISHPVFPEKVRVLLEMQYIDEVGFSIGRFEEAIQENPEKFVPVLATLAEQMPDHEMPVFFLGVCLDAAGDSRGARKMYRRTLRMPASRESWMDSQVQSQLTLKLQALNRLDYSRQVQLRYLREFWQAAEEAHDDASQIDIILYAALSELNGFLKEVIDPKNMPVCRNIYDERKLHNALLFFYYQIDAVYLAYEQAEYLYANKLLTEVLAILVTAFLFEVYEYEGMEIRDAMESYESINEYLVDHLIELEQLRLEEKTEQLRKRLKQLYRQRQNQPDPDWMLFDDFLRIFHSDLGRSKNMQPVIRDIETMMPEMSGQ